MCVEAALLVKVTDSSGKVSFPIKAINVLKAHGKSTKESRLIHGYALNCTRAADGKFLNYLSSTSLFAFLLTIFIFVN